MRMLHFSARLDEKSRHGGAGGRQSMAASERGLQLRCRDGHFEMATFELQRQEGGFWMWVSCEFDGHAGGHWLAPDQRAPRRLVVTATPHMSISATEAHAARDPRVHDDDQT